jgi:hypothetical protein
MSRSATARFEWAGEERTFRLAVKALQDWQEESNAGPAWVWGLLHTGAWEPKHVEKTLYHGLVGGGMPKAEAARLVKLNIEPYGDNILPAMCVLEAVIQGVPDDLPKNYGETVASPTPIFPVAKSASPPSGDGLGQWAST